MPHADYSPSLHLSAGDLRNIPLRETILSNVELGRTVISCSSGRTGHYFNCWLLLWYHWYISPYACQLPPYSAFQNPLIPHANYHQKLTPILTVSLLTKCHHPLGIYKHSPGPKIPSTYSASINRGKSSLGFSTSTYH